jgi:type II secretory pathway pseudopilin PulG
MSDGSDKATVLYRDIPIVLAIVGGVVAIITHDWSAWKQKKPEQPAQATEQAVQSVQQSAQPQLKLQQGKIILHPPEVPPPTYSKWYTE